MDDDIGTKLLDEVRKQARFNKRMTIVALAVLFGFFFVYIPTKEMSYSWSNVTKQLDKGNTTRALKIALRLVNKTPNDYYAHREIANVYLEMNDITNAEKHYSISYKLYPGDSIDKMLQTIRKRMGQTNSIETVQ